MSGILKARSFFKRRPFSYLPQTIFFNFFLFLKTSALMDRSGTRPLVPHFPPGFRFHPTDQELINHYLRRKISSSLPPTSSIMAEIDLYKFNPWELPEKAFFGEKEWFFFSPRDRKYPNGIRPNRAAGVGYWKATGTDKPILAAGGVQCIGVKKALVFYQGRPPKGTKTGWIMHEYRLLESTMPRQTQKKDSMRLDDWVLCVVKHKGAMQVQNEEISTQSIFTNSQEQRPHQTTMAKGSFFDWGDTQLIGHLLHWPESLENGRKTDSDSLSDTICSEIDDCSWMKRKSSSFSAINEQLMELHPSKKLVCSTEEQQWWPADFFSFDGSMEFVI